MTIADFFYFSSKMNSNGARFVPNVKFVDGSMPRKGQPPYPSTLLTTGEYEGIALPVEFLWKACTKMYDIVDTGHPGLSLISDRFRDLLLDNGFTGWKTYPIVMKAKNGEQVGGYHGLSIVGRCGPTDFSKSEIVQRQLVPGAIPAVFYKGLHIGLDAWDGTDMFIEEGTTMRIVTERVAKAIKRAKITNVRLENLADFETIIHAVLPKR